MDTEEYSFKVPMHRVLRQVHPSLSITGKTSEEVNNLLYVALGKILDAATLAMEKQKTIKSTMIQAGVRLALPDQLAKHAVSEGVKAITKFNAGPGGTKYARLTQRSRAGIQFQPSTVNHLIRKLRPGCGRVSKTAAI